MPWTFNHDKNLLCNGIMKLKEKLFPTRQQLQAPHSALPKIVNYFEADEVFDLVFFFC